MDQEHLKQRAFGFPVKKQLGQNFLINREILEKIVDQISLQEGDHVLEIGPGLGFLTEILVGRGAKVTSIELDPFCVAELKKLSLPNLEIIEDDFLKIDLNEIINKSTKIIGNIPYNITSPIIGKLMGEIGQPAPWLKNIDCIVLTVQRELADRLIATPGNKDYSQITLLMNYFGTTQMALKVAPENFSPPPQVYSSVIRFVPHEKPKALCQNHALLKKVIQAGFAKRRKMLKNNLRALCLNDEILEKIFQELNFDPHVRAEYINLEQFARLTDVIEREQKR